MESAARVIIGKALRAATVADAEEVQNLIAQNFGKRYQRPVGDRWTNFGMLGTAGSFDLKLIEQITNMQDAVIERFALRRFRSLDQISYESPHRMASELFAGKDYRALGDMVTVTFRESDPPARRSKRLTAVFRDHGCGLTASQIPKTIFALGSSHKESRLFLQGAFGMGGATTYRNAAAVVLVSRRDPQLLAVGEADQICVAVLQWEQHTKGTSIFYLVDRPWREAGDYALPWSASASDYPEFEPGTHLGLISYGVEGFHRARQGDERTFDTVVNTRLFQPVLPVRFRNELVERDRRDYFRGLARRLRDNPSGRESATEVLPFTARGATYHLPITYFLFPPPGDVGERRKFVAKDHAVVFTSNGQVHHHWTPITFRTRTRLNKLHDRIFVVVETDGLPIEVRTALFTPDRSDLIRSEDAIRLENTVEAFLREWAELDEANRRLIRESLRADAASPTLGIAQRISRAFHAKGFSLGGSPGGATGGPGSGGGGGGGGGRMKPITLYRDPTRLEGPDKVQAELEHTRTITYVCDVVDEFWDGRGQLQVTCDHPDIGEREITVGKGRGGRVRVSVAVPTDAALGTYSLDLALEDWMRAAGGLGAPLRHTTKLEIVESIAPRGWGKGKPRGGGEGQDAASKGTLVAVVWSDPERNPEWTALSVGEVVDTPAEELATERDEYADLAVLGAQPIPTVFLNEEYKPFKTYLHGRSRSLVVLDRSREEYAVGVGVGLLALREEAELRARAGEEVSPEAEESSRRAVARAVLAMMPAFDDLVREAGIEGFD